MFNIDEHVMTEVVCAGRSGIFDEIRLPRFMQSEMDSQAHRPLEYKVCCSKRRSRLETVGQVVSQPTIEEFRWNADTDDANKALQSMSFFGRLQIVETVFLK